jgi:RNAse (barnase) inhibitor barstar
VAELTGWTGDDALSVVANPTEQTAHIPGMLPPHRVAVHPAPTRAVCVGWRAPREATIRLAGRVQHAHPACGNGVAWSVELRRGSAHQRLAAGTAHGDAVVTWGPLEELALRAGDFVVVKIDPREGNHACDLTLVDLTVDDGTRQWDLARELSPDLAAANPHPDAAGQPAVWWLTSEPASGVGASQIPPGSLLAAWQTAATSDHRRRLASQLQRLIDEEAADLPTDHPDAQLRAQLVALGGPLLTFGLDQIDLPDLPAAAASSWGLDPALFGRGAQGESLDSASLAVQAPTLLEIRLPASLAAGYELATSGRLAPGADQGSVQLYATAARPQQLGLQPGVPVLTAAESSAQQRWSASFAAFQRLFPPSVCYTRMVPVDEVVTLTLFYREDDRLQELALDEEQTRELDRLWDELLYVAEEPLQLVDAFEQLMEFATQDRADLVTQFATMREPILARADAYRARRVSDEPAQLAAALALADRAYRRPLSDAEATQLREFYHALRSKELGHAEALRLVLVRIFVSPKFLYRTESPPEGVAAGPVSAHELATRLSYFLWSSLPDAALRAAADEGRMTTDDELLRHAARLQRDPKIRRLAEEFACQWLHVYQFDRLDEKSARHFPEFAALRGAMYEETIRFFTDLFQRDGSVLDVLDADYAFVNDELAAYYDLPSVAGPEWRRVEGVRQFGRGGILAQAAVLARQAGASRTSPILRGNFVCEALLGEPPPKPPKNVPPLAETPQEGLTERQLTELHVSDPACAKCHARIDPFGFALEGYDAVGRARQVDAHGLPVDTRATLPDGAEVRGLDGLRAYLLQARRDAFVRQFNRKLLGFALGRGTQLSDEPLLDAMQQALVAQNFRVGAALEQIVLSRQFREIRGAQAGDSGLATAASSTLSGEPSAQE